MFARRLFLLALVLATLLVCFGCATPDLVCGVRADYQNPTRIKSSGTVLLHWDYQANPSNPIAYGDADCWQGEVRTCNLRLRGAAPDLNDVCALAKLGHEVAHSLGADHERN